MRVIIVSIGSQARRFQVGSKTLEKVAKTFWKIESTLTGCHQYWMHMSRTGYSLGYQVK
jgi:hypothetical protein